MEVSGKLHDLVALIKVKEPPCTYCIGAWLGPWVGLDAVENSKMLYYRGSSPSCSSPLCIAVPIEGLHEKHTFVNLNFDLCGEYMSKAVSLWPWFINASIMILPNWKETKTRDLDSAKTNVHCI
jgi:hypothetical protein